MAVSDGKMAAPVARKWLVVIGGNHKEREREREREREFCANEEEEGAFAC